MRAPEYCGGKGNGNLIWLPEKYSASIYRLQEEEVQPEKTTEIEIAARHILKTKEKLNKMLSENTGKPLDVIAADTDRDNWMTAEEACAYGLIDSVITNR